MMRGLLRAGRQSGSARSYRKQQKYENLLNDALAPVFCTGDGGIV